jgi:hypothetical protein
VNQDLQARIAEQEVWTFKECLGLGALFNVKPRFVIAMVLAQGKDYVDGDKPSVDEKRPRV